MENIWEILGNEVLSWLHSPIFWFFAIGGPLAIICTMIDEANAPPSCPHCDTKFSPNQKPGRCRVCQRTVVFGRDPDSREREQMRREEEDIEAVRKRLWGLDTYDRILEGIPYSGWHTAVISVTGHDKASVEVSGGTYGVSSSESGPVVLAPVPLGFRIETKAGEAFFLQGLANCINNSLPIDRTRHAAYIADNRTVKIQNNL